jgi:hypothetical protein
MKLNNIFIIVLLAALFVIPTVSAYSKGFPMMNLWDVFVENIFGSFLLAVLFLNILIFIILVLGNINLMTIITYLLFFNLAMTLGYGVLILVAAIMIFGAGYLFWQVMKLVEGR